MTQRCSHTSLSPSPSSDLSPLVFSFVLTNVMSCRKLVGNVSNSDLKAIGYDAALLSHLFIPITEFRSEPLSLFIRTNECNVVQETCWEREQLGSKSDRL